MQAASVDGHVVGERARAVGRRIRRRVVEILGRERDAVQRAAPDVRQAVALARLGERALAVPGDDGADARILGLEPLERRAAGLLGRRLAAHEWRRASCVTAAGPYTHAMSFRDDSNSTLRRSATSAAAAVGRVPGRTHRGRRRRARRRRHRDRPAAAAAGRRRRPRPARRPPGPDVRPRAAAATSSDCRTGADANARQDCRILGYVNSVQAYWRGEFARRGRTYTPATTYFESDQWQTGCGAASTDVGPFYCPADKNVYIDLGFLDELRDKFGATGGSLAQGYVIAHEYGHHIQDLLGTLDTGSNGAGRDRQVGAHRAAGRLLRRRVGRARDRDRPARADHAGGDRRRPERRGGRRRRPHPEETQGEVNPETWTHGSSAQRQKWFTTGYQTGDMKQVRHVRRLDLEVLEGRRILVTGASSGIGRAVAQLCVAEGARVLATGRRAEALEELDGVRRPTPATCASPAPPRLRGRGASSGSAASTASCTRPAPCCAGRIRAARATRRSTASCSTTWPCPSASRARRSARSAAAARSC